MKFKSIVKRYADPNLVLVYQYGKVGSTSLADSIPGGVNVHSLYATALCPCGFRQRYSALRRWVAFPIDRFMRRVLIRRRPCVDIIVPLRVPWERNLSMFFQDLPFWYVQYFAENKANQKIEGIDLIKQIFETMFDHDGPERWFREEFCRLTGMKFGEIDFDKAKGFSIAKSGKYRVLFLTTEYMRTSNGIDTIAEFLGRPVKIDDSNRGDRKWYGHVYRELLADEEYIQSYRKRMESTLVTKKFFD